MYTLTSLGSEYKAAFGYNPYEKIKLSPSRIEYFNAVKRSEILKTFKYNVLKAITQDISTFLEAFVNAKFNDDFIQGLYIELLQREDNATQLKHYVYFSTGQVIESQDVSELAAVVNKLEQFYPFLANYDRLNGGAIQYKNMSVSYLLSAMFARLLIATDKLDENEFLQLINAIVFEDLRNTDPLVDSCATALAIQ